MDISKRVAMMVLLIIFTFAALNLAFTFTQSKQLSKVSEIEQMDTLENVERVQNTVATEQDYLDNMVQDWAGWDDTYRFIDDKNPEYINTNLQNQTLYGLKVNVMIFVDDTGSVVYTKSIDLNTGEEKPISEKLLEMVEKGYFSAKSEDDIKRGCILLDENPMLVSCHPILKTSYEGPVKGTLIFGRYFDDTLLSSFKESTRSSLYVYRIDEKMPSDIQTALEKLQGNSNRPIVKPLSQENVSGYFGLRDFLGKPAVIIRADFPRTLYSSFKNVLDYMYLFLTFAELMLLGGFWAVQLVPLFDG